MEIIDNEENSKVYKIAVIDDEQYIETVFTVVKDELKFQGKTIEVDYIKSMKGEFEIKIPYDIVIFDLSLNASNFMQLEGNEVPVGYTLIQKFREKNRNTKVILYSDSFDLDIGYVPFSPKHLIKLINELSVFRIIEREASDIIKAIEQAINDLDLIISSVEGFYKDYCDEEVTYEINGKEINVLELLYQLKTGGEEGKIFRKDIIRSILHFMLKIKF